jgi:thioester reductase-like protein
MMNKTPKTVTKMIANWKTEDHKIVGTLTGESHEIRGTMTEEDVQSIADTVSHIINNLPTGDA